MNLEPRKAPIGKLYISSAPGVSPVRRRPVFAAG